MNTLLRITAALCALMAAPPAPAAEHPARTWTSRDGRSLEAALLHADRQSVTLKLRDGREAVIPIDRLGEADRAYLAELSATGSDLKLGAMPLETKIDPNVPVEGGPRTFVTPHFTFDSERGVTKAFISEAARVFEGTLEAVRGLPLGIDPKPAEGESRFRTRFLDRESFEREFLALRRSGASSGPGLPSVQNVAGVYLPGRREVLVPFSSLETTNSGSRISLRRGSDSSTLIHEITHQVMHDWLPMMPLWVSEGLAEYLSAVPYQNGRFEFKNAAGGLKESLRGDFGVPEGQPVPMHAPSAMVESGDAFWRGGTADYLSAMLLVYYFIHLDQPDKPCAALAAYLHLMGRSRQETETFIAEYNAAVKAFEEKRSAYNREIDAYNARVAAYRAEVAAYNDRVRLYNDQVRSGVPEASRVAVGAEPVAPEAPKPIEVPAILKENASGGGAIDVLGIIRTQARPALYRGREGSSLDEAVRAAYAGMGIALDLNPVQGGGPALP